MDPFSSLNLVRSTYQLIDWSSKLLSGAYEIYHSPDGLTEDDARLSERTTIFRRLALGLTNRSSGHVADGRENGIVGDPVTGNKKTPHEDVPNDVMIQLLSHKNDEKPMGAGNKLEVDQAYTKLQKLTSEMKSSAKAFAVEDVPSSEQEQSLQRVAKGCDDIARRLETTLKQLRVDPKNAKFRKISSFRQAFVKLCSQKKIDEMERTLDKYRTDLILQLSVIMSDQQSSAIRELRALRDTSSRLGSAYEEHLDNISKLFRLIQTQVAENAKQCQQNPAFQHLAETLRSIVQTATDVAAAQRVLSGLHYKTMTMRIESVSEAYADTYEWIFKPRWDKDAEGIKDAGGIKVHFSEWLAEKDGIFWVSGKPGSGKSTLMKFLCDHDRTAEALTNWARPLNPVISTHFFWSSGTTMQKSQEGLLRSLLYDVFKKSPKIMKMVCPQRWEEALRGGEGNLEPWTLSELRRTLTSLATCHGLSYKFCFFIDGLDEYEGDHSEIIAILRPLATSPHIKLCVSSRPWNVFEDEYGKINDRKLYLQDLTSRDIRHYVQRKLEEHPNWQVLPSEEPLYNTLLEEVTTKAQGVFLWVYLVVRSLYEGLTNGDSLPTLEQRIRDLPADLESFFKHILDSVEPLYYVQMVRTFQVAMGSTSPLPLMIYSFLDEDFENQNSSFQVPVRRQMPMVEVVRRQEQLRRRLNGRCKGLLEICRNQNEGPYMGHRVDFLHRTVRDFLRTKEMSDFLTENSGDHGEINTLVFRSFVLLIKSIPFEEIEVSEGGLLSRMLGDTMHYAYKAELESREPQVDLLNDLRSAVKFYATTLGRPVPWYPGCYTPSKNGTGYAPCQTFLEFAIQNGLCLYVRDQLRRKNQPLEAQQPLIHCAIAHLPRYTIEEPDLTPMVRVLLEGRKECHAELLKQDAWKSFIMVFVKILMDEENSLKITPMIEHRQGIIQLLLVYGADANARWKDSLPVWRHLLVAIAGSPLPSCSAIVQITKDFLDAGARPSDYDWSISGAFATSFSGRRSNRGTQLDFIAQICCLLISKGMELTASEKHLIRERLPERLFESISVAIEKQRLEKRPERSESPAAPEGSKGWTWTSWLGISW